MRDIRTLATLGAGLRAERERRGMTQKQLAHAARLSRATVISIESGGRSDVTTLLALVNALDLELRLTPRGTEHGDSTQGDRGFAFDPYILEGTEEL